MQFLVTFAHYSTVGSNILNPMHNNRVSNPVIMSSVAMCFVCVLTNNEMALQVIEVERVVTIVL